MRDAYHLWIILAVGGVVLFVNLGTPKLWDRDEPRNAGCAVEMMERGDWVTPMFNAELRTHKPVLLYWFMMSAYALFGVNEFSARIWSAVLALGTALATYAIGRRLFNASVGLWSAVVLLSCIMFTVAGRAATPDSVLIFFCTLALMVFVLGTVQSDGSAARDLPHAADRKDRAAFAPVPKSGDHWFPQSWPVVALLFVILGFAILAKGPVGIVLPTAVMGMFLLIMRPLWGEQNSGAEASLPTDRLSGLRRAFLFLLRLPVHFLRTCWYMRPLTAIAVASVVAVPWYVWVGLRTDGEWLRGFFIEHNVGRAMQSMEGHGGSILYYPAALLIGFFPWSVFWIPAMLQTVASIRQRHPWTVGYVFASCWVCVYVGAFSIARTKLPSYITPCYPALALLTGVFIHEWMAGRLLVRRFWLPVALASLMIVGLGMLIGLPIAADIYLPGGEWLGVVGLLPMAGAIAALVFVLKQQDRPAILSVSVSAVSFIVVVFGILVVHVDRHQKCDELISRASELDEDAPLASYGAMEPSWVFYARKPITEIDPSAPEMSFADESRSWVKPKPSLSTYLANNPRAFIITTDEMLARMDGLPNGMGIVGEVPFFMQGQTLVMVGPGGKDLRATAVRSTDTQLR